MNNQFAVIDAMDSWEVTGIKEQVNVDRIRTESRQIQEK